MSWLAETAPPSRTAAGVTDEQLARARERLVKGDTLHQVALRIRVSAEKLDIALWNRMGRSA